MPETYRYWLKILIVLVTIEINTEPELITYPVHKEVGSNCALWNLSRGSVRVGSAPSVEAKAALHSPRTHTRAPTAPPRTPGPVCLSLVVCLPSATFGKIRPDSARPLMCAYLTEMNERLNDAPDLFVIVWLVPAYHNVNRDTDCDSQIKIEIE